MWGALGDWVWFFVKLVIPRYGYKFCAWSFNLEGIIWPYLKDIYLHCVLGFPWVAPMVTEIQSAAADCGGMCFVPWVTPMIIKIQPHSGLMRCCGGIPMDATRGGDSTKRKNPPRRSWICVTTGATRGNKTWISWMFWYYYVEQQKHPYPFLIFPKIDTTEMMINNTPAILFICLILKLKNDMSLLPKKA